MAEVNVELGSIMGVFDTHLRWKNQSDKSRRYEHYHPSSFGQCLRKQQYLRYADMGFIPPVQEKFESITIRLFDKGHNMHNRWSQYAQNIKILRGFYRCANIFCSSFDDNGEYDKTRERKKPRLYGDDNPIGCFEPEKCVCGCKKFYYEEVRVQDETLNISGNCDMIWDFSRFDPNRYEGVNKTFNMDTLPKGPIVVDMKTCNDYKFKSLAKSGPSLEYRVQLTIYNNILPGIEYGLLLYENKNDSNTMAFKIEKNTNTMFKEIKEQARKLNLMVETKKLPPPRPEDSDNYGCKGCLFKERCLSSAIWNDPNLNTIRKNFYGNLM